MTDHVPNEALDTALDGMRSLRAPLREAQQWTERRDHLLPGLQAVLAREAQIRARRRWLQGTSLGGLASAAIAAGAFFTLGGPAGGVLAPDEHSSITARGDGLLIRTPSSHATRNLRTGETAELSRGDYVLTGPGSRGSLRTTLGVGVELDSGTELSLEGADQETLYLHRGSATFQVPKQPTGHSFVVQTTQANVVVHGTKFRVSIAGPDYSPCVQVFEGLVSVEGKSRQFVRPGEALGCHAQATAAMASASGTPTAATRNLSPTPAEPAAAEPITPTQQGDTSRGRGASDLAAQNALFQEALKRARRSDVPGAKTRFRELLRKYPQSPLAERAQVELLRLSEPLSRGPSQ
jgi:ferric-dicitrate binding protein FerR (iron transport regulator)